MKMYITALLASTLLFGCSTAGHRLKQLEKVEQKITKTEEKIDKHAKANADGVVRALSRIPLEKRTPEVKLALRLANNTQTLLGQPEPDLVIDVDKLLSSNMEEQKFEEKRLLQIETAGKQAVVDHLKLTREKEELQKKIQADLAARVEKEKASFWWKVKFYGVITLLVGGLITLFVANPALFTSIIQFTFGLPGKIFRLFRKS